MATSWLDWKCLYIDILVTHPGSVQGGGILIEYAVNLSEAAGFGGRLELHAMGRSTAAYLALGFVMADPNPFGEGGVMKLNPAETDGTWALVDQEWRLTKYSERKTFAA